MGGPTNKSFMLNKSGSYLTGKSHVSLLVVENVGIGEAPYIDVGFHEILYTLESYCESLD